MWGLSAAQAETFNQSLIARLVRVLEVIQQLAALVYHLEQPATGMVVLCMLGEMPAQTLDAGGEQRHLHFR